VVVYCFLMHCITRTPQSLEILTKDASIIINGTTIAMEKIDSITVVSTDLKITIMVRKQIFDHGNHRYTADVEVRMQCVHALC
jgi:hypothetical protein